MRAGKVEIGNVTANMSEYGQLSLYQANNNWISLTTEQLTYLLEWINNPSEALDTEIWAKTMEGQI